MKRTTEVDAAVGKRLRVRRKALGVSQSSLAEQSGVTFQQIQKYENGTNRIGASRLYRFATVLNVPVAYFFEELPQANGVDALTKELCNAAISNEGFALNHAFLSIKDPGKRKAVVALVRALAE